MAIIKINWVLLANYPLQSQTKAEIFPDSRLILALICLASPFPATDAEFNFDNEVIKFITLHNRFCYYEPRIVEGVNLLLLHF